MFWATHSSEERAAVPGTAENLRAAQMEPRVARVQLSLQSPSSSGAANAL